MAVTSCIFFDVKIPDYENLKQTSRNIYAVTSDRNSLNMKSRLENRSLVTGSPGNITIFSKFHVNSIQETYKFMRLENVFILRK